MKKRKTFDENDPWPPYPRVPELRDPCDFDVEAGYRQLVDDWNYSPTAKEAYEVAAEDMIVFMRGEDEEMV